MKLQLTTSGCPGLTGFFIGGVARDSFSREAEGGFEVGRCKSRAFFLQGLREMKKKKLPDLSNLKIFNESQRQEIRDFIQSICPHRWNIFEDFKNYKCQKGILNIHLEILNYEDERDHNLQGVVHSGMGYRDGVGKAHLILQPTYLSKIRLENLIIHELAHVGIQRWVSYKRKLHLKEFGHTIEFGDDILHYDRHGSAKFRKMAKTFKKRVRKGVNP